MKKILLSIILSCLVATQGYSIAPPKKGVKVPQYLQEEFKQIRSEYSTGYWAQEFARRRALRESALGEFSIAAAGTDTARIPIIIGRYPDLGMHYSKEQLQNQLFDGPNPTGTITQYYMEDSYGKLYVTGKVADWYTVPQTVSYYAGTDGKSSNGRRDFVIDLLMETDSLFDFSPFIDPASNTDGYYHVRFLGVIHTGAGAEAGADNIWSHKWNIRSRLNARKNDVNETFIAKDRVITVGSTTGYFLTNDTYNGVPVVIDGDYACEPELSGSNNSSGKIIEIGVFCHEFGHIFGLPDLYDTDGTSEGIGQWCLMSSGSWGGDGSSPQLPTHMCAWCKIKLGWITTTNVSSYQLHQPIRNVEYTPEVFRMWSLGTGGVQYFLVENRQKIGFDQRIPSGGLLIYHVDDSQSGNTNENHYMVDVEQADGLRSMNTTTSNRGDAGDPFPGNTNNRRFDGYTNPNSKNYANGQTYVGVRNINSSSDTMYADLDVGTRPYLRLVSFSQSDNFPASPNRIEPGENGVLNLTIENIHPTPTSASRISLKGSGAGFTVDTNGTPLALGALSQTIVPTVANVRLQSLFVPKELPITIMMTGENFIDSTIVPVVFGYPGIAVLDGDSVAQSSVLYVRSALDSANKYYEVLRTRDSLSSDAALQRRTTLIYLSGTKKYETISAPVLDSLVQFYQRGGRILMSGQNIAEDLQGRNVAALSDVFHVRWSKNLVIGRNAYGVPTDPLGTNVAMMSLAGGDGAANQTSPDILLSDGVSVPCLTYGSVGGTNIAGLHVENFSMNSKLVFLGFGLESINNGGSTTTKGSFMQSILNWFDTPVGVSGEIGAVPYRWALEPAYPNPFNPSARIQFEAAKNAFVEIFLYNILGQKVRTLLASEVTAGKHTITVDGTGLSSGIYFCRLSASSFSAVQRLALLK